MDAAAAAAAVDGEDPMMPMMLILIKCMRVSLQYKKHYRLGTNRSKASVSRLTASLRRFPLRHRTGSAAHMNIR